MEGFEFRLMQAYRAIGLFEEPYYIQKMKITDQVKGIV
jgi:hypothetical protein